MATDITCDYEACPATAAADLPEPPAAWRAIPWRRWTLDPTEPVPQLTLYYCPDHRDHTPPPKLDRSQGEENPWTGRPAPPPQDAASDWACRQAAGLDPNGPPVVLVCPHPAAWRAAHDLEEWEEFTGGRVSAVYTRGAGAEPEHVLARALAALGAEPEYGAPLVGAWRTATRYRPRLLVAVAGARHPDQVRALVPTGRGSLLLASPAPDTDLEDLWDLEIHPGARFYTPR